MELGPVGAIRAVGSVGVNRSASDVTPAFAVEGSGRMEDDSYAGERKEQDRGMEEEDDHPGAKQEEILEVAKVVGQAKKVNCFA